MHDFQEQSQVHGQQCQVRGQRSKNGFYNKKIRMACIIKQLLDLVFVISGIIKVLVSVISLSLRPRLITLTSTLNIPDITKTSSNNCLLSYLFHFSFFLVMPAYSAKDNALAVKLLTVFPENSEQGQLPAIMANVMVFDSKNGLLKAVSFFFLFLLTEFCSMM